LKAKQKCQYCGKIFFSTMTEVFVKKEIQCIDCKEPLKNDFKVVDNVNITTCPKCGKTYTMQEVEKLSAMVRASTRSKLEKNKWIETKDFFEKVLIPESQYCQRCKNYANMIMQRRKNQERLTASKDAVIRVVPKEDQKAFERAETQYYIQKKIQEERQERMKKEQEEAMKKQFEEKVKASQPKPEEKKEE